MSSKKGKSSLKRRIEALEMEVERLKEKNQDCELEIKRLKGEVFRIDILIGNPDPGLQNIAMSIFRNLDPKSVGTCRAVSKGWLEFINNDTHKCWWKLRLSQCKKLFNVYQPGTFGKSLGEAYPFFMMTMDYIYENESKENIKLFFTFMLNYRQSLPKTLEQHRSDWESPLHFAAVGKRFDIFDLLVKSPYMKNLNVHSFSFREFAWGFNEFYLLEEACRDNQTDVIEYFMNLKGDQAIDFNERLYLGRTRTLFHQACESNQVDVVKLFLENADRLKIDLNVRDKHLDDYPIMLVKKREVMELLLNDERIALNGTSPARYADEDWNVFHEVCRKDEELFELMFRSPRVDIHKVSHYKGNTMLHFATDVSDNAEIILKEASQLKIDVNRRNEDGETPAHCAFQSLFRALIDDKWRFAGEEGYIEEPETPRVVEVFLKYGKQVGIDFEARDKDGRTPLHHLCLENYEEDIRPFLITTKEQYSAVPNSGIYTLIFSLSFFQCIRSYLICLRLFI